MKKVIIVLVVLIVVLGGYGVYTRIIKPANSNGIAMNEMNNITPPVEVEIKEIQTFKGDDRPIAVMIDNHENAKPQTGLNDAYIVYEIIVEGGITRMMAVFKGVDTEDVGPIRSSRHYFLDYAMENDALYAHYGWSPQAESDIYKYDIDNMNGITEPVKYFPRNSYKYAPHNVITSIENLKASAESSDYRMTSKEDSLLNYNAYEFELEDGTGAIEITIEFSEYEEVEWVYNEDTKRYEKTVDGDKQYDWITDEPISTKNIIIVYADNYSIDSNGRQNIDNIGVNDGYYITNGKVIDIIAEKDSREEQTVYKDLEGNEIEVNDGNTYIAICPPENPVEFVVSDPKVSEIDNTVNTVE